MCIRDSPNGFFNDEAYTVQFEISSDSAWEVVGNAVNGMDEYILTQEYICLLYTSRCV